MVSMGASSSSGLNALLSRQPGLGSMPPSPPCPPAPPAPPCPVVLVLLVLEEDAAPPPSPPGPCAGAGRASEPQPAAAAPAAVPIPCSNRRRDTRAPPSTRLLLPIAVVPIVRQVGRLASPRALSARGGSAAPTT